MSRCGSPPKALSAPPTVQLHVWLLVRQRDTFVCAVATVSLASSEVTVTEGDPPGTSEGRVCVDLDVPVGGIACDIVVTLNFTDDTASMCAKKFCLVCQVLKLEK